MSKNLGNLVILTTYIFSKILGNHNISMKIMSNHLIDINIL